MFLSMVLHLFLALIPLGIGYIIRKSFLSDVNRELSDLHNIFLIVGILGVIIVGLVGLVQPFPVIFSPVNIFLFFALLICGLGFNFYSLSVLFVYIVIAISFSSLFHSTDIANLIDVDEVDESFLSDPSDKRLVVDSSAIEKAKKTLGTSIERFPDLILGSIYTLDTDYMSIDSINDELVWVIPLKFSRLFQDRVSQIVPGFITVSATSHDANAKLHLTDNEGDEYNIRYTSSSWFGFKLRRSIQNEYRHKYISDINIHLTDDMQPMAIAYIAEPKVGYKHFKSVGIVVKDIQTGESNYYTLEEAKTEVPWLETLVPYQLTLKRISDWGSLREGFLAQFVDKGVLISPTIFDSGNDMAFINSDDSNHYYYTGMTSNSSSEDALSGMMRINTVTGKAELYRSSNSSGGDEDAAVRAVNSVLGINSDKWTPKLPIPYNLFEEYPTYVVPVISNETGMYVGVGLVNMEYPSKTVFHKSLSVALRNYVNLLDDSDQINIVESDMDRINGVIDRFHLIGKSDVSYAYIIIDGDEHVYECNADEIVGCYRLGEGDDVSFLTIDNGDEKLDIRELK